MTQTKEKNQKTKTNVEGNDDYSSEQNEVMLTTFDNPYNPFTQFERWFLYDTEKGYNSCSYLARIARTSDEFTDEENAREIERAIDEIIKYDFMNIYKKVYLTPPKGNSNPAKSV